jgi:AcrR family transcriptional regulator
MTIIAREPVQLAFADQRSAEILAAGRRAFIEKGFDGASMQDLARAVGMSVGNFYRYFPSKDALIAAMIARDMEDMERDFAMILTAPRPMEALRTVVQMHVQLEHCQDDGRLWAETTAAGLRKPEIGAILMQMEQAVVTNLVTIFARATGRTEDDARRRWSAQAQMMVLLVKGINMHCAAPTPGREHLTELVLRTINKMLDEIAADTAPPQDAVKG